MGVYRSHHAAPDDEPGYDDSPAPLPHPPSSRSSGRVYGRSRTDPDYDQPDGYDLPSDYDPAPDPEPDPYPDYDVDWEAELDRGRRGARTPDEEPVRPPRSKGPMGVVRAGVRGFGELLITFGLVVLLFAGYEVWGKAAQVDAAQGKLDDKIERTWGGEKAPKAKPLPGDAIARLYIPRLDKHWVVVQGVAPADIKHAPGHYPDSAMPGKLGNFAVAGHRAKAMFWDLDKLKPGDKIFVEDKEFFYEYVITETKIVLPNAVEVVAPVPGKPGEKPKDAMLTLTTCNPKWDNYERLIVHAKATGDPRSKAMGMPPELGS